MNLPDKRITCPYTAQKKSCHSLAMNCPKFVQIAGTNPNTGEPVNQWGCADTFIPMLLIENSQQQRQTGAAVESLRNEAVQSSAIGQRVLLETVRAMGQQLEHDQLLNLVHGERT